MTCSVAGNIANSAPDENPAKARGSSSLIFHAFAVLVS